MQLIIHFTSITGRRESNEDHEVIFLNIDESNQGLSPINFFCVCDGHGGDWVSSFVCKNLPKYYTDKNVPPPFTKEYHEKVFKIIQNQLLSNPKGYSNGSTCLTNIMYRYNNEIHMNVLNLGDSRMVIVYNDYSCKQITTDHKPDEPNERARLERIGGNIVKDDEGTYRIGDLSLSKAFGDGDHEPYISQVPDVYYKKITKETKYIVMACDGLWDVIETNELGNEIKHIIEKSQTQEVNMAVELANVALNKNSTDNITIIVIEMST